MTKATYIISTVVSVLLSLLLGGQIASAASPYDSIVHTTQTLKMKSNNGAQERDITSSLLETVKESCPSSLYGSLTGALNHPSGKVVVTEADGYGGTVDVLIVWTEDANAQIQFMPDLTEFKAGATHPLKRATLYLYQGATVCGQPSVQYYSSITVAHSCSFLDCNRRYRIFSSSYPVVYPPGYQGELIPGASDGDTDNDGLSDYVESPNYPNRDDVFCGVSQCAYPDPTKKDVYLELDWMKNGATTYKPTQTQLALVKDMFAAKNINLHIDTGQYGGGNELPSYIQYLPFVYNASLVGFFDLKNGNANESIVANFDPARDGIWRYLITGYGYDEDHSSSGASYTGSGNLFVSVGTIGDNQSSFGYTSLDTAIAGTIVHELGHSLCMSQTQKYSYQSTDCQYSGVDAYSSTTYGSVLNYNLQMFQTELSTGSNGTPGDHDDWAAIKGGGIADFASWNTGALTWGASTNKVKQRTPVQKGITIGQAQAAQRNGTLGMVVRNGRLHDLRKGESRPFPAPGVNGQLGLTH